MGVLNLGDGSNVAWPLLKRKTCILCHRQGIQQIVEPAERESYDYKCSSCSPNTTISVAKDAFDSGLLEQLRINDSLRAELRSDVRYCDDHCYIIDRELLERILHISEPPKLTYANWIAGNFSGSINHISIDANERASIRAAQINYFKKTVQQRFLRLTADFDRRVKNSIKPLIMVSLELAELSKIFSSNGLDFKPTPGEAHTFGSLTYRTELLDGIRKQYNSAILGTLDFSEVPSENQKIGGSAKYVLEFKSMVEAMALSKYQDYLNVAIKQINADDADAINFEEMRSLNAFLDQMVQAVEKQMHEKMRLDAQTSSAYDESVRHREVLAGMDILYDAIADIKEIAPNLTKNKALKWIRKKLTAVLSKFAEKRLIDSISSWMDEHTKEMLEWGRNLLD
jgi:hypothetical protein